MNNIFYNRYQHFVDFVLNIYYSVSSCVSDQGILIVCTLQTDFSQFWHFIPGHLPENVCNILLFLKKSTPPLCRVVLVCVFSLNVSCSCLV